MTRPKRPGKPPLGVQVQVLLIALGLNGKRIEWDHRPPLALRPVDPETGELDPPANDPRYIQVLAFDEHAAETKRDMKRIAKAKRQSGETGQRKRREMRKILEEQGERARPLWPKGRKMKSRPFERR